MILTEDKILYNIAGNRADNSSDSVTDKQDYRAGVFK